MQAEWKTKKLRPARMECKSKKLRHSLARGRCEPIAPFATTGALAPQRSAARPTCSDGGERKKNGLIDNACCSQPALCATYCYKHCRLN